MAEERAQWVRTFVTKPEFHPLIHKVVEKTGRIGGKGKRMDLSEHYWHVRNSQTIEKEIKEQNQNRCRRRLG